MNGATVTGVGFSPQYVIVRANDTATARQSHQRPLSLAGTASQLFGATANSSNGIRALLPDGFQLGTDASVNTAGVTYHRAAFRHTGSSCAAPGAETVAASADAWVNEASPTTNTGAAATMNVLSRSANRNGRMLVTFVLPALPAGCSVTDARLRLYDRTPVGGRTLLAPRNAAAFAENTVNWTNQPAVTGPAASAITPSAATWMQWDVTAQTAAMYPPGATTGFQVRDATESASSGGFQQVFDSRTGTAANQPQLVVTFG